MINFKEFFERFASISTKLVTCEKEFKSHMRSEEYYKDRVNSLELDLRKKDVSLADAQTDNEQLYELLCRTDVEKKNNYEIISELRKKMVDTEK